MSKRTKQRVGARHASPVRKRKSQDRRKQSPPLGKAKGRAGRRRPRVPPPESTIWPEEYRGANWKPAYGFIFEGKCQVCAHSCPLPLSRQRRDRFLGVPRLLHCTNHPCHPGGIEEVLPTDTCRNFKPVSWKRPKAESGEDLMAQMSRISGRNIKRIFLSNGLFALVDAADYKKLSQYRWYASHHGRQIYAICRRNGKERYMHRMLMRPRKGYVVDHIDHNGLNNRRCNLRVCTPRQHQANRGPTGGSSRFVGVFLNKRIGKWQAHIMAHGKHYYLGVYDDEVEAAKARDRKAYELHGEFAYLNFPEDFAHRRRRQAKTARAKSSRGQPSRSRRR